LVRGEEWEKREVQRKQSSAVKRGKTGHDRRPRMALKEGINQELNFINSAELPGGKLTARRTERGARKEQQHRSEIPKKKKVKFGKGEELEPGRPTDQPRQDLYKRMNDLEKSRDKKWERWSTHTIQR